MLWRQAALCLALLPLVFATGLNWHVSVKAPNAIQLAANPFPLTSVRLADGTFWSTAQSLNLAYLINLNSDSLLWNFRTTAGLPAPGTPYPGWEDPTCQLRGHFVGHYLSASAMMWASTGNSTLQSKMASLVTELKKCQDTMGTGYLSGFPTSEFDMLEAHQDVWAPYYTIHKIMAGLLDQYTVANNSDAYPMVVKMANYFAGRINNVMATQGMNGWQQILNNEWGGMNEVMYSIYDLTQDPLHLQIANLFDHYSWSRPLAAGVDDLPGNHANTHIPEIIGNQRAYEVVQNVTQQNISVFFYNTIKAHHSWVTAGSNYQEYWGNADQLGDELNMETEESCTQYNIMKVARHFFTWNADPKFFDFYERAIFNGIVGNQKASGTFIYMMPIGSPGQTKGNNPGGFNVNWGSPYEDFWCCYGTMIEAFSKLGDSIYFYKPDNSVLYVNQFIPSTLSWTARRVTVTQQTDFPSADTTKILVSDAQGGTWALNLRVPSWATGNNQITINGQAYNGQITPGTYVSINRQWGASDTVVATFSMDFAVEKLTDNRAAYKTEYAFLYGPLVLAGMTSSPFLVGDPSNLDSWWKRTSTSDLTFVATTEYGNVNFMPLLEVVDQSYTIYFNTSDIPIVPYNPSGSLVPSSTAADFLCSDGAEVVSNPDLSLRSGDPDQTSIAYLMSGIQDTIHVVDGLSLQYRYVSGYSGGSVGANFSIYLENMATSAQVLIYSSPHLTDYPYDSCNTCYSPPVSVSKLGLALPVKDMYRVRFTFQDNDRNVQLLVNMNCTVHWQAQ